MYDPKTRPDTRGCGGIGGAISAADPVDASRDAGYTVPGRYLLRHDHRDCSVDIGVGAIGRQVALQLAAV